MENAADALYMGFAVIAFVVALSLSIFSFSQVTSASQAIIDARDKTTLYSYIEPQGTERIVTREDIIPTLYRAFYEDYIIRFEGIGPLYNKNVERTDDNGKVISSNEPSSTIENIMNNHEDAREFITVLLQGGKNEFSDFLKRKGILYYSNLQINSLYDILEGKMFYEKVGIYYLEDKKNVVNTVQNGTDDINKTKKRVITYKLKQSTD